MWYTKFGKDGDVVLSTRVRLARNIKDIPFGRLMTKECQEKVISICRNALSELKFVDLNSMPELDKNSLLEQHLISPAMIGEERQKGLILNDESTVSVMLGEEDHIRIQAMAPGFELDECMKMANEIDDRLESKTDYAFSEDFGYLTCCPTNVGTGMRASVMMHLPALARAGQIEKLISLLSKLGITVRGIYGEGSCAFGDIFQISNQVTLGVSEEEIIEKMKQVVSEIVEKERNCAKELYEKSKYVIEDRIMRSLGILKNAVILDSKEAMEKISDVRLGINLKIIEGISYERINEVMYKILPATLAKENNIVSAGDRDIKRAEITREMLSKN